MTNTTVDSEEDAKSRCNGVSQSSDGQKDDLWLDLGKMLTLAAASFAAFLYLCNLAAEPPVIPMISTIIRWCMLGGAIASGIIFAILCVYIFERVVKSPVFKRIQRNTAIVPIYQERFGYALIALAAYLWCYALLEGSPLRFIYFLFGAYFVGAFFFYASFETTLSLVVREKNLEKLLSLLVATSLLASGLFPFTSRQAKESQEAIRSYMEWCHMALLSDHVAASIKQDCSENLIRLKPSIPSKLRTP